MTIIVIVLVVVIVVPSALAAILYVEVSGLTSSPPGVVPIGAAFLAGNPSPGTCTSTMVPLHACAGPGDFDYTLQVFASTVSLGDLEFVVDTAMGSHFLNSDLAGLALVTNSGVVAAYVQIAPGLGLAMTGTWTDYGSGFSASTPLFVGEYSIVIDVGQNTPTTGAGLEIVAVGVGHYSGTTSPLALP